MTKREDYAARLTELVNQLAEEGTHVDVDSDLVDDVGLSSIEIMELIEQLEDAYDIEAVSTPSGVTHLTFTAKNR